MKKKMTALLLALLLAITVSVPVLAEESPTDEEPHSPILIACFSATGTTMGVAEKLREALDADLYEIVPEEPYTAADLDWNDRGSRTSEETDDPECRPGIAGELPDLAGYDMVYIGYPIWWGDVPRIVSNFVESVDLADRAVAVFFTSGGSGLGNSMRHLEEQAGAGTWLDGKRFTANTTVEELAQWAESVETLKARAESLKTEP